MVLNGIFFVDQGLWFVFLVLVFFHFYNFFLMLFTILPCYMVFESHSSCFLYIHICVCIYMYVCVYIHRYINNL